jgi:transcriptional regulator with XRE-family HTH domain
MESIDLRAVLGRNLRAERARAGLLQDGLAAHVGVSRSTVVSWEAGKRRIGVEEVVLLCEALGVGLFDLLAGGTPEAQRARKALLGHAEERRRSDYDPMA